MDYRKYQSTRFWSHLITGPLVWLPLPFMLLLDLACELYQAVCFPVYGIAKVKRSEYILILDRTKLAYLNPLEKLACMYCGYGNGVLLYIKEIAGRTEKYWCGIMHAAKPGCKEHQDQVNHDFAKYNNKADFDKKYPLK